MPGITANMPPQDDDDIRKQKDAARTQKEADAQNWQAIYQQITGLQSVVNQLTSIVDVMEQPAVGSAGASAFVLGTGWTTVCSLTLAVPAGATRAFVSAVGVMTAYSASGQPSSFDVLYAATQIAGATGPVSIVPADLVLTGTAAQSLELTGLTGGSTITVALLGHLNYGPGSAGPGSPAISQATLSASAQFLP